MSARERDTALVRYRVTRTDVDRLHVEADIAPAGPKCRLSLRATYGPACGYAAGIASLALTGARFEAPWRRGRLVIAASRRFRLSYDCILPDYVDVVSLLRGFRRGDTVFCPGMALFFRLHDPRATYDVDFDLRWPPIRKGRLPGRRPRGRQRLVVVSDRTSRPAARGCRARVCCRSTSDLERLYVAVGNLVVHTVEPTTFVHEVDFRFATDEILAVWPLLSGRAGRIFGDAGAGAWTAVLFASPEHEPGRPGAGFAIPSGALVSLSADDAVLASPHTLWLLLHERVHHWLGESIGRGSADDDWFFEGFTSFAATHTLGQAGVLSPTDIARLAGLSRRRLAQARRAGRTALAHAGFLCALRWDELLASGGSSLAAVLAALIAARRGQTLGGDRLLAALAQACPDNKVPAFVARLARSAAASDRRTDT